MDDEAEQWKRLWRDNLETAQQAMRERDEALAKLAEIREQCVNYTPDPSVVDAILAIIDG